MTTQAFAGKRIIITGGASGIGEAVAKNLCDQGAWVSLFDVDAARLEEAAIRLGDNVSTHVCDVTSERAVQWAHDAERQAGPINGLVCCAGSPDVPTPAEDLAQVDWNRVIETHLGGTLNSCRIIGKKMLSDGGGVIVNVASVLSFHPGPVLAYGAAKAAIVNVTASLAVQWASRGIRVNAVAPGWTDTPFLHSNRPGGARDLSPILAATPLHRLLQASEIAEVVAFLLSPRSSAIVGTTVVCDGGVMAASGWSPYGGVPG